jgi:hypothetical protein
MEESNLRRRAPAGQFVRPEMEGAHVNWTSFIFGSVAGESVLAERAE